jgi:hypothetical protein
MTLYLHQMEHTEPHTQSGYSLPEIKLRLSKLSWVTLKLSLGRLQSSTAPSVRPYKTLLNVVPCILKSLRYCFTVIHELATVRHDVTQLPTPGFEKCDQLSHWFPETECENQTLTSWAKFFALWQESRSNIHCIGHPSLFIQVMHYQYTSTIVKISGKSFPVIKFRSLFWTIQTCHVSQ